MNKLVTIDRSKYKFNLGIEDKEARDGFMRNCNPFDLDKEPKYGVDYSYNDHGFYALVYSSTDFCYFSIVLEWKSSKYYYYNELSTLVGKNIRRWVTGFISDVTRTKELGNVETSIDAVVIADKIRVTFENTTDGEAINIDARVDILHGVQLRDIEKDSPLGKLYTQVMKSLSRSTLKFCDDMVAESKKKLIGSKTMKIITL